MNPTMDEEVAAEQDKDYMYFGYWLQFPEDTSIAEPEYRFAVIHGGPTAVHGAFIQALRTTPPAKSP